MGTGPFLLVCMKEAIRRLLLVRWARVGLLVAQVSRRKHPGSGVTAGEFQHPSADPWQWWCIWVVLKCLKCAWLTRPVLCTQMTLQDLMVTFMIASGYLQFLDQQERQGILRFSVVHSLDCMVV